MKVLSLDIGGANTKIALLYKNKVKNFSFYFPFWKRKNEFKSFLKDKIEFLELENIDAIGITMTAEVSDAFQNKDEGVKQILNCIEDLFSNSVYTLKNNAELLSIREARMYPYEIASANWVATAFYVSKKFENGILIDIGSTTTDIIPIKNGKIKTIGKTDTERLQNNELLYTGILRTNVATILSSLFLRNKETRVSSELFATTADVYLILGDISEKEYVTETADNRSKSRKNCMARLARVVCADLNILKEKEIIEMAMQIKEKQIKEISDAIRKVVERENLDRVFICGKGGFLAREAAKEAGIQKIEELDINPAIALAFMISDRFKDLASL